MISPGCGGLNIIIFLLVIIRDFRIVRISILPNAAFAVAIVYSNTVLAGAVVPQGLQGIARRTYIVETPGRVKLEQLAKRDLFDRLEPSASHAQEDPLGVRIAKRTNHPFIVYR